MTEARISGHYANPQAPKPHASPNPVEPVLLSAIGIVRGSAGLVGNVVQLGVALFSEAKKVEPSQPTILGPNIFMFPTNRRSNPKT